MKLIVLPLMIVPLLTACGSGTPVSAPLSTPSAAPAADAVGPAVRAALGSDVDAHYFDAVVDLTGDGKDETVVYAAGPAVCGTGGCPVYVFTPSAEGLRLVSSISAARPPVRLSPRSARGWRDLIVAVGGGGMSPGNVELEFDGVTYPSNATVPPAAPVQDLDGTQVLIPEFDSYTAGKVVPMGVLGDPAQPVAGSVLGEEIHAQDAEGLRHYVLRRLTDRFAMEKGIAVTQEEIDAYIKRRDEAMKSDPSPEDRAAREESAGAFIWQWKVNKALYEQYGGWVIFQQGGPEPLDAYRKFLEQAQSRGEFTIATPELEKEFWRYYRDDSLHEFFPPGSPQEKQAFTIAPWES